MYERYLNKKGKGFIGGNRPKEKKVSYRIFFDKYKMFTHSKEEMENAVAKLKA